MDLKNLSALASVVEMGSFGQAAKSLYLTQSAVSQRIKDLEDQLGQALLIRNKPLQLTEAGTKVLKYYQKVAALEEELKIDLNPDIADGFKTIKLAINNDNLEYWFLDKLSGYIKQNRLLLELSTEDEKLTADFLKKGQVFSCISSEKSVGSSYQSSYLGKLRYRCVASKKYFKQCFAAGVTKKSISEAACVLYNQNDYVSYNYLDKHFGIASEDIAHKHFIPSPTVLEQAIDAGLGFGLLPEISIQKKIRSGRLVDLAKNKTLEQKYYLHSWYQVPRYLKEFNMEVVKIAKEVMS